MIDWPRRRRVVLDLFVLANIAFLAVDTYLAHSVNRFAHTLEWVPFGFSILATSLFAVAIASCWNVERRWGRWLGLGIGGAAIIVGISGMIPMIDWPRRRRVVLDLFVLANIAFLAVDTYLAHSVNRFAHTLEWVPFGFSILATSLFAVAIASCWNVERRWGRWLGLGIGGAAIIVGISGMILHLESQFFELQTIGSLVYTAPFAAPLAYAGLGLLILMNRMVDPDRTEWARWIVLLGLGGFVGNLILSLCDHAQNGSLGAGSSSVSAG